MIDQNLPLTSFFNKKDSLKQENINFHFTLIPDKDTDSIKLLKYKKNPSLKYRHDWLTCFEPENHLDNLTEILLNNFSVKKSMNIYGYSFKDNSTLERIKNYSRSKKQNHITKNSFQINLPVNGVCLHGLFNFTNASNFRNIVNLHGKADILIVRHVLEHSWNIKEFLDALKVLVSKNGLIVFEIPDSEKGLRTGMQTLLWEEHAHYFTEESFKNTLKFYGFEVQKFMRYPNKIEDSLVAITKVKNTEEIKLKLSQNSEELLEDFQFKFNENKFKIMKHVENLFNSGIEICLFGAGHHASSFVSINQIQDKISFVIDDNVVKQKYYLPGSKIPIVPSTAISNFKKSLMILLTTNPENNQKITSIIQKLKKDAQIKSIFSFYV
jgi:hypothetical protein